MSVRFFSGGAGCGKTYMVMFALEEHLREAPLLEGQKVLALTYMHGSRRRLHERLSGIRQLSNKFECLVIDSLAWRIVSRWQSLLNVSGFAFPVIGEFNRVCEGAGVLLANDMVCRWVAATYPVIVVDEAQDLDAVRLNIVQELSRHIEVIAAADEFQCLEPTLQPNPACKWLEGVCSPEHLAIPRRTNQPELLAAAHAVRSGGSPKPGKVFQIVPTAQPALAGTYLSNAIGWYGRGKNVAVITPATGAFATAVVDWVSLNSTRQNQGPYFIEWEHSESQAFARYSEGLQLPDRCDASHLIGLVAGQGDDRMTCDILHWLDVQRRTQGRSEFSREEIFAVIQRSFSFRKHTATLAQRAPLAMTVHGAKNREFDLVVVLWPAAIAGSADQKRRLFYNAVTRAKSRCLVLVQAQGALKQAPFV